MKSAKKKVWFIPLFLFFTIAQLFASECGDVNSDSRVNIVDSLLIAQKYVNLSPSPFDSSVADVNADNKINIIDALLIAQFYVNIIDKLPGCGQSEISFLRINEFMASNAAIIQDPDSGEYADWIEIYNGGSQAVDLYGYYLSDNLNDPGKWQITQHTSIEAGAYIVIWADGVDSGIHTSFKLAQEGEEIGLFSPDLVLLDSVVFSEQTTDMSEGRDLNNGSSWVVFSEPTPGKSNSTTAFSGTEYSTPDFSVTGGFYTSSVTIELTAYPGAIIRYTTDGSEPGDSSPVYNAPIQINRTTILRARIFKNAFLPGPVVTHSYFINENSSSGTLPVISIASDPENFWDPATGIYVQDFKPEWEVPINIELFENNGSDRAAFNQTAGTKINGTNSWELPQKYLGIYFRKQYTSSNNKIEYPLFFDRERSKYKSFGLRTSGSDWSYTLFRDALAQDSTRLNMDLAIQGYRPCVVYIDGQYMGIHNMRSKLNDDFIEENFAMESGSYDLISYGLYERTEIVEEGSIDDFKEFKAMWSRDMSIQSNYEAMADIMDIENFTDWIIAEIYVRNTSVDHNVVEWKPKNGGKWRWILCDTDRGFFEPSGFFNTIHQISTFTRLSAIPFGSLMKNPEYQAYFTRKLADHLFTTFHPERMKNLIDQYSQVIEKEIPYHVDRWQGTRSDYGDAIPSTTFWQNEVNKLKTYADNRSEFLMDDLTNYGVGEAGTLRIMVSPANGGYVNINGLKVPEADWSGLYSQGLQSQLSAVAKSGYTFRGWSLNNSASPVSTSAVYSFTMTSDMTLTAVFTPTGQSIVPVNITGNLKLSRNNSPYVIQENTTILSNSTLTIEAGVEILVAKNANILVQGSIIANGTAAQAIVFRLNPVDTGGTWGAICITNSTATSYFSYVTIEDASHGPVPIKDVAAISAFHANLELDHITIEKVNGNPIAARYSDVALTNSSIRIGVTGDGINIKYGHARVENCTFRGGEEPDTDAIDYDDVENGLIVNNVISGFYGLNSDAIDIGEKAQNIQIENNLIWDITDKGVSVGQKSSAIIKNCTIVGCNQGLGLKDLSSNTVDHCTFYGNGVAIACYEKNLGDFGGKAVVTNSILSNSSEASYTVDDKSSLDISYSLADNTEVPQGSFNIFSDPGFNNPEALDFSLKASSPCIGAGNDYDDMGSLIHGYRGEPSIMITGIYYNPLKDDSKTEFITLYNPGSQWVDLSSYKISKGIDFEFPQGTLLGPGEFYLLSKDPGLSLIGASSANSAQWTEGSLANEGEIIVLVNKYGMVVDYVDYKAEAPWPLVSEIADVLVLNNYALDNHLVSSWSVRAYAEFVISQ
ncbi:MAG: CotH kinase family protein [Spirochaetales bacterium]|nr:CotH kinase family protein [Spirochaetales bacterium]